MPDGFTRMKREKDSSLLIGCVIRAAEQHRNEDVLWFLRHMGRISSASIVESDDVRTASISRRGSRYRIRVSADFMKQHIHSPDCLLYVVLHEIYHKMRGDLHREPPPCIPKNLSETLSNIAADMLINAELRKLIFSDPVPLHYSFQGNQFWPGDLLEPPELLLNMQNKELKLLGKKKLHTLISEALLPGIQKFMNEPGMRQLRFELIGDSVEDAIADIVEESARIYTKVWLEEPSPSYIALMEALSTMIMKHFSYIDLREIIEKIILGDHDGDEIPGIRLPRASGKGRAGEGESGREEEVEKEDVKQECWALLEAIRRAMEYDFKSHAVSEQLVADRGVVPFPGRRETYLINSGYMPSFYPNPVVQKERSEQAVHVYLDVSGSVDEILPLLFALLQHVRENISEPVFEFSTEVEPVNLEELEAGVRRTTGGTEFHCVAEHALNHKFRKILVITDGDVGELEDKDLKQRFEKNVQLYLLLTEESDETELIELAGGKMMREKSWWVIPEGVLRFLYR